MRDNLINIAYLIGALGFALSLKWMTKAATARKGLVAGEIGFAIAVVATLFNESLDGNDYILIAVAILIGSAVGVPLGLLVPMTAMPQRIALSHAFGGIAVGLVGLAHYLSIEPDLNWFEMMVLGAEIVLGMLVFTGSLMAAGKLQGWLPQQPILWKGQNAFNFTLLGIAVIGIVILMISPELWWITPILAVLGLVFGVLLIIPIGGADMPTVIALLNSYAGLSAAGLGIVLDNKLLIVAGALDGMSGLILAFVMCRAMNPSFSNVLYGGFGAVQAVPESEMEQLQPNTATYDEAADLMKIARSVVIIPGYGMAVAQAQHKVRELADALAKEGVDVKYAIHPVAGRMPGHMNVLLAEANVPYEQLLDMEDINPELPQTDVVLVLGANDVVNPAARYDESSPIYGMPILDADKAQTIMVVKLSLIHISEPTRPTT